MYMRFNGKMSYIWDSNNLTSDYSHIKIKLYIYVLSALKSHTRHVLNNIYVDLYFSDARSGTFINAIASQHCLVTVVWLAPLFLIICSVRHYLTIHWSKDVTALKIFATLPIPLTWPELSFLLIKVKWGSYSHFSSINRANGHCDPSQWH